jgi:hypothetical protein
MTAARREFIERPDTTLTEMAAEAADIYVPIFTSATKTR